MSTEVARFFSEQSPLATEVSSFRPREQQREMALAVADAIKNNAILVAEAGTGTGKTFAYLVPALLGGGKVIISTGTKNLQDQLFQKDLPMVRDALKAPVSIALLKGRANYICHYHLERTAHDGRFATREDIKHLGKIKKYAKITSTGDKSGVADVPENAPIWLQVTSTRDNCLGQECPNHKECFVLHARTEAMKADIVVVNHHLFFADVMLKDDGVAELLPACNTVIFDEAHQLPETASLFFGENLSTTQLLDLAQDSRIEALTSAKDFAPLPKACDELDKAARDLRLVFKKEGRMPAIATGSFKDFAPQLKNLSEKLKQINDMLESQAARSEGLENCWQRAQAFSLLLKNWQDDKADDKVRWLEVYHHSLQLNATPLSIAEIFEKQIGSTARAWIFTSATLAVKQDFSHYQGEMGLLKAKTACWDSPFDYEKQALLYVPSGLPEPNSEGYTEAVIQAALPMIEASRGRAFLLFTSLRAMQRAHEILTAEFDLRGWSYPLLLQGEGSRNELLGRFREHGNAVLLGSQSFWEGVDVRGEALSLVIIDKLPFAPPDDPVLAARIAQISKQGRNAFMEYQLPRTIITLKQGAGRLIRDENDRGVLMICDPRLITKQYGKRIWQSLPPMKRTRVETEAVAFFTAQSEATPRE
ncbi:ATP-dependent DNA helicase [Gallionella capsiferriformans]|uniref:DNA 5'-3' helicase n=1 Tax=Gallionella capsiferriformans (strain ES-2) TaxID=395494 RepID=D9SH80_GALCS|nr:ATP-dependent DNA helicase [Gallionella capsiferriformans]ADL55877.1 type III restriction protein res subunit [Gallionella capsiferriformans ES-2]